MEREAPPPDGVGTCGHNISWKCLSCHDAPTYCIGCLGDTHRKNPFHRVQHWTGGYWEDAWLRQAGVIIRLGHSGEWCAASQQLAAGIGDKTSDQDAGPPLVEIEEAEDSDWEDDDEEDAPNPAPVRSCSYGTLWRQTNCYRLGVSPGK